MRRLVPHVFTRSTCVRIFTAAALAAGIALTTVNAQIPGRNVNMVAGTEWPDGDPFLQRQNEPSIAASTRNPLHLLGGSNDYRTVDVPGLPGDEIGDAWLGLYKSFDGGQRWISTLLPGYPQDHSPEGLTSPIHGYGAAADPVVRAGTNGLIYYAGLVFDRSDPATPTVPGKSAIFVARFIDNNNKEAGDTFAYLGTRTLQTDPGGPGGNFLDKPWLAVDIPRDSARCTIVTPGEKGPITQTIPAGPLYVAYTLKSRDAGGDRYDVMFSRSGDCGNTWTTPVRVNNDADRANQGATIAIDPKHGDVYVAWRRFDLTGDDDAIMTRRFNLPAKKFDPPGVARRYPKGKKKGLDPAKFFTKGGAKAAIAAAQLAPFDQGTSPITELLAFRTNAYPSMTIDHNGRIYMVWSERGYDPVQSDPIAGDARVMIATSNNGRKWTEAQPVALEGQLGHQIMPSVTFAGGKLVLVYYDLRETRAQIFSKYIDDVTAVQGPTGKRHTIDLRASMADPGAMPAFAPSVRVSDYLEGPRTPGGPNEQLQVNPPNLPMFMQGTAPFIGDYVDLTAAPQFITDAQGRWISNTAATATPPIFHAVWTDNRDVRPPRFDTNGDGNPWNDYSPPGPWGGGSSLIDPTQQVPMCVAGNAGSRNQNVYTARITGGLMVGSPGNTKTLSPDLQRAFVVFVQNTTDVARIFRLTIVNQPAGGRASFEQFPLPPYTASSPPPLTVIEAVVPQRSTIARTVYVTSTDPHARITISVNEIGSLNGATVTGGLGSAIVLNPDIDNPDIDNPDIDNPDIDNPDIDNAEVYNPDIDNPHVANPDIDNPDIDNPDIDNPDIDNVRIANPDIDNPDIDNPDIDNPDIDNPDIDNPDIDNPDIDNNSLMTDVSWTITNTGNTSAAYNVNLFFAQTSFKPTVKTQLILHRVYKTPVAVNCDLKFETRNVVVTNVPNPQLVRSSTGEVSNPNDPDATNATIYLAPGESARITLRIFDPNPDPNEIVTVTNPDGTTAKILATFVPNEDITPVVQQQGVNTRDAEEGVTEPPLVVQFPAPQAVADSASTAENTPVRINVLANDSTAFGSTKIISFHPAGMAAHAGGPAGDLVYQPSSGYLYTQRGAVDPATDALVARFPAPPGAQGVISHVANPRTGINYGRGAAPVPTLFALDARPDTATFHQYLPMPALPDAVFALAVDTTHNRLYVLHSPNAATAESPTTVTIIDADPGSDFFHQVIGSVSLPSGIRAQSIAVNSRTERVYVAAVGVAGGSTGGVFIIDTKQPETAAVRAAGTTVAFGLAINEAANRVFASSASGNMFALYVIDGDTGAVNTVTTELPAQSGGNDERLAVHEPSGKVLMRLANSVVVIDGQPGSPTGDTVLAVIDLDGEAGTADIAVDQELGLAITVGSSAFRADVIDIGANALATTIPLNWGPSDVAIDPINHRAFVSVFTHVEEVSLSPIASTARIPVFVESGGVVLNPATNRTYAGILSSQASIGIFSGAGAHGTVTGAGGSARYLFGARHHATGLHFMLNQANADGTDFVPGSLMVIDSSDALIAQLETLASPFGIGIDQASGKVYVASNPSPAGHGGITIYDANNLAAPPVYAQGPSGPLPGGFPLSSPQAMIGFGRHVEVNPATGKVYALQSGGSPASIAVLDPATNILTPLDGVAGTPIFDAQQRAGETWGRALIIRVHGGLNLIYVGMFDSPSGIYRLIALNGATHEVVGIFVGGSHSNRHTASYIAVNEAAQRLYVVDYANDSLTMLNAATLDALNTVALPDGPSATAYNVAAKRLYVSSIDAKTISAIDAGTLRVISSVRLPLVAHFLVVDEIESRIYTSGGDSPDESGLMVVTDVLGQLGTDVRVTSVGTTIAGGSTVLNADYSVTYTPPAGYAGPDSFTYNIEAPTGTAIGTVSINVVPTSRGLLAFGDTYNVSGGGFLSVAAPGPLANDAVFNSPSMIVIDEPDHGTLDAQPDGSFIYTPNATFGGVDSFRYYVSTDTGVSNAATVFLLVSGPAESIALVVTNANDSGEGSLRDALEQANLLEGMETIAFNIPGAGPGSPAVITVSSPLPIINESVVIDATTQPGWDGLPVVQLRSPGPTAGWVGLQLHGGSITIRGLSITEFETAILSGQGTSLHVIEQNLIGTTRSNATGVGNGLGMNWRARESVIQNNVISGNISDGVSLLLDADGNAITQNRIGVGTDGVVHVPNGGHGIVAFDGPSNTLIQDNVISGNGGYGISLANNGGSAPVANTRIRNNIIGLDANAALIPRGEENYYGYNEVNYGPKLRGNGLGGIQLISAPGTTVGELGMPNTISGNTFAGIRLSGTFTTPPVIQFNRIGTDPSGMAARGNIDGIVVENGAGGFTIGGPNAGNVISGNLSDGIHIASGSNINIHDNVIGLSENLSSGIGNGLLEADDDPGCCHAGISVGAGNSNIQIGGMARGNQIAGNNTGIRLEGSVGTLIHANNIGLPGAPNRADGILMINAIDATVIANNILNNLGNAGLFGDGITDAVIEANTISGQSNHGVVLIGEGGGNRLIQNSIHDNGGLGIDLGWDGVTANDDGDADGDPNGRQNYPVLSDAENNGDNPRVTVSTMGFAPGQYVLQFFSSSSCDASGSGEGQAFMGEATVAANTVETLTIGGFAPAGYFITATARAINGDTSEFSVCAQVSP